MKKYILILLFLILVLLLGLMIFSFRSQYHVIEQVPIVMNIHGIDKPRFQNLSTIPDAAYIQPWMTFEYLDVTYRMSPVYLQLALNITNSQYPRISIRDYAASSDLDVTALTQKIITLVQAYIANGSNASTSNYY